MLPEEKINSKKTSLSKRMKSLLENPKHRVLVFRNGESREGVEIVANRFDEVEFYCKSTSISIYYNYRHDKLGFAGRGAH